MKSQSVRSDACLNVVQNRERSVATGYVQRSTAAQLVNLLLHCADKSENETSALRTKCDTQSGVIEELRVSQKLSQNEAETLRERILDLEKVGVSVEGILVMNFT